MRVLAFAASLRRGSLNRKLIECAAGMVRDKGAEVDLVEFSEFEMPMFDGDDQEKHGIPPGARALCQRLALVHAVLIATPEYNYSVAGTFKNAIDWVSRVRPMPWRGKSVYLMAASPSPFGGIRGLWHSRVPLEACGALVFPDMFALAHADQAFTDDGRLIEEAMRRRLDQEMTGFLEVARALVPTCRIEGVATEEQKAVAAALEEESSIQP